MSSGLDCIECGGFIDMERSDELCFWCLKRQRDERAEELEMTRSPCHRSADPHEGGGDEG